MSDLCEDKDSGLLVRCQALTLLQNHRIAAKGAVIYFHWV